VCSRDTWVLDFLNLLEDSLHAIPKFTKLLLLQVLIVYAIPNANIEQVTRQICGHKQTLAKVLIIIRQR
jgi:hypothetical protein